MKRFITAALVAAMIVIPVAAMAVGTVTQTVYNAGHGYTRYTLAWVSDASGDVNGNTASISIRAGHVSQIEIIPDGGATAPTALYDVTLVDENSVDWLNGAGTDQSATLGEIIMFNPPIFFDGSYALDLVVANAGNAKGGTVIIYVK